ncbi:MyfA/PsaA family fimbrial adhesin [Yersinia alsatica]|uniref:MyfA/PsaA family fimbrial adhesin n=1 Tax=Yersinia alsatica TaxID=2890317 RepID=UPI00119D1DC7|nr:MyfA/PsaA family fimbrial adhesin [Yersinia alsatica]
MKKFAKKHLAIAAFMMALGGMANMAHANLIYAKDVSADKEVKQGGSAKVEFVASEDTIVAGKQLQDVNAFVLKVSDSAEHSGWSLVTTGDSAGGYMYNDSGDKVGLHSSDWDWEAYQNGWHIDNSSSEEVEDYLYLRQGQVLKAGVYHFTGRVEEYL